VISGDDPSEYVPVAVNFPVARVRIDGLAGEIVIDCSTGTVTVSVAVAEIPPKVAVIVSEPSESAVTRPLLAGSLLTVANVPGVEVQTASKVRS